MAHTKKPTRSRKGSLPKRKALTKRQRSLAAKKGWRTRKQQERKAERESIIVGIEGPHGRQALTMDWNGSREQLRLLAKDAKRFFPNAIGWQYAFRFRFVSDVTSGEGEERWVSIPFARDFKSQLANAMEYAGVFTSGQMNYGIVMPLEATIVVQEGNVNED